MPRELVRDGLLFALAQRYKEDSSHFLRLSAWDFRTPPYEVGHILAKWTIQQIPDPVTTLIPCAARPIVTRRLYTVFLRDTGILLGPGFKFLCAFF